MSTGWEWTDLPPDNPQRVARVLAYIESGSQFGVGRIEWETIKAVLGKYATNYGPSPDPGQDEATARAGAESTAGVHPSSSSGTD